MVEKYDKIGKAYNRTRQADTYLTQRFYTYLNPISNHIYLDIGCGTGNYTVALNQKGIDFIGVDPSAEMLKKARKRNSLVDWGTGKSDSVPLESESVDGILASLTIHHWEDLNSSFRELCRVLRSDGKLVIFTSTAEQMDGYWLNHYFPKMMKDSANQMPSYEKIERNLRRNDFKIVETEKYFVRDDLQDLFLYSGKHNPELYLDAEIRKGISSFSSLAKGNEVETGLGRLRDDIKVGKVQDIIREFDNKDGDYLFLIAHKN